MDRRGRERRARGAVVGLIALLAAVSAVGDDLRRFAKVLEQNQQRLRRYTWTATTEFVLDGQPQWTERHEVRYDAEGGRHSRLISSEAAPDAEGDRPRGRAAKKRYAQQKKLLTELTELMRAYVQPDAATTQQIFADASVWQGEGRTAGITRVQARNVLRQGDQVSLWLSSLDAVPQKLEILTSSEGEPVRVKTEFAVLEQGPFYPAKMVIETELKEKKLVMTTETSDYRLPES
jgi:hypothetical protein